MIRSVASKVMWVGRATVFLVGLSVILALVLGVASMASGADGDFFKVGKANIASAVSVLTKSGVGPALSLKVDRGAPLAVNSSTRVTNLNADKLDGKDSAGFQETNAAAGGDLRGIYPNPQITAGAVGATELATLPAVRAVGTEQSISWLSDTLLQLPNEDFDQVGIGRSGQMHSTTTNNSRLTAPRDGIYQINVQVGWASNPTGWREAGLTKNSGGECSAGPFLAFDRVNATPTGYSPYNHLGTLVALEQGDYVEVCVSQNSGAGSPLSTKPFTFATMHYVSGR